MYPPPPSSPIMKTQVEDQPFLEECSNDAGQTAQDEAKKAVNQARYNRDLVIFLLASLFWIVGIFSFLPSSSSTPSVMMTTAQAVAAGTVQGDDGAFGKIVPVDMSGSHQDDDDNDDKDEVGVTDGLNRDVSRLYNITTNARLVTCGNSTAEAQREGCQYDILLNAWVPSQCLDLDWIEEYQDDGSWAAFEDRKLTKPLPLENMGLRDYYYTSVRDHVNHCSMMWRKQFWTLFEGRRLFDSTIVNPYHTEHCAEFLSSLMTMNRTEPILVNVGFSGCWIRPDGGEL